ncbi:MAG: DUF1858 domain-containing protein [Planctomycetota bacterium]
MAEATTFKEEMTILEAVQAHPDAAGILQGSGMHCLGCVIARGETLGDGARAHGIPVEGLLAKLNALK